MFLKLSLSIIKTALVRYCRFILVQSYRIDRISDIIETKNNGIFTLLDEESKLPKPSFLHFTTEVHGHWPNHFRLGLPRSSRLKAHRSIRDSEGFLIRHFAGAVCYQTVRIISYLCFGLIN